MNNQAVRDVSYSIDEDLGIIGWGFDVEWCVEGLDRELCLRAGLQSRAALTAPEREIAIHGFRLCSRGVAIAALRALLLPAWRARCGATAAQNNGLHPRQLRRQEAAAGAVAQASAAAGPRAPMRRATSTSTFWRCPGRRASATPAAPKRRVRNAPSGADLGFVVHGLWPQYNEGFPSDCGGDQVAVVARLASRAGALSGRRACPL